jgi:predicted ester cyclase
MDNTQRFRAFVEEVLNAHDPGRADEFLASSLVDHSLPEGTPGTVEGFREWFSAFLAGIPDQTWTIDMIFEEGNLVAHQKTVRGTHTGDLFGIAGNGRSVETYEVGIARFADGKMVEFWGSFDEARLLRQVGVLESVPA